MKGRTFWVALDLWETERHLRFVISYPDENNLVMVVHMTKASDNRRIDSTCILQPGEHNSIRYKSYIWYQKAITMDQKEINDLKNAGSLTFDEDAGEELLKKNSGRGKEIRKPRAAIQEIFPSFLTKIKPVRVRLN